MENVKVKVLQDFRDRECGLQLRKAGEEYEVRESRAKKLEELRLVQILQEKTPPDPVPSVKKKSKK